MTTNENNNQPTLVNDGVIIGELKVPILSIGPNSISYEGPLSTVFFGKKSAPIKINESIFLVIGVDGDGNVVRTFNAVVTGVRDFAIINVPDGTDQLKLKISYKEVGGAKFSGLFNVKPIVSNILADGNLIGLFIEGETNSVSRFIDNNLSEFSHGDKIYKKAFSLKISKRLESKNNNDASIERIPVGMALIGTAVNLTSFAEFTKFVNRFLFYIDIPPLQDDEIDKLRLKMVENGIVSD